MQSLYIDHEMLVRVWQELDYRIDVCQVTNGGHMETCKVCTETLKDTLSSGTNLSSMSATVTDLQTHETPEGLLTCPVLGENCLHPQVVRLVLII